MAKPHLLSAPGILMMALAVLIDLVNIILGFLDLFLIGLILSPIWNALAMGTLGALLWTTTGQGARGPTSGGNKRLAGFLAKKIVIPFIGNSIPISKFFPWWVWSVWSSLDKGTGQPEAEQQEEAPQPANQPQTTPAPA